MIRSRRTPVTKEQLHQRIAELEQHPDAEVFESEVWHELELLRAALETQKGRRRMTDRERAFLRGMRRGYVMAHYLGLPVLAFGFGVGVGKGTIHFLLGLFVALASGVILMSGWLAARNDNPANGGDA